MKPERFTQVIIVGPTEAHSFDLGVIQGQQVRGKNTVVWGVSLENLALLVEELSTFLVDEFSAHASQLLSLQETPDDHPV